MTSILITMAGRSTRFKQAGIHQPKYRLQAKGRTLFSWAMASLSSFMPASRMVFVTLREDCAGDFICAECSTVGIAKPLIVELEGVTAGQAATAFAGLDACHPAKPVAIFNIDTHVRPGKLLPPEADCDGYLPCFRACGDHWSFVRLGNDDEVIEVREKSRISALATTGLYWFRDPAAYHDTYRQHFTAGQRIHEAGEAYIAPMYNTMIARGGRVTISEIDAADVVPLGTPAEVAQFVRENAACG